MERDHCPPPITTITQNIWNWIRLGVMDPKEVSDFSVSASEDQKATYVY